MKTCHLALLGLLWMSAAWAPPHKPYCLHEVYRLENEGQEIHVYWIQLSANQFLAVYELPREAEGPGGPRFQTLVSPLIDDRIWIGPRLHSLQYRIQRWHKTKIGPADCREESPTVYRIKTTDDHWIVLRKICGGPFRVEVDSLD